ncbi:LysE family translocator [Yoonia sp. R2331]|uniref:LysE family translocator n=1 Tax=Yoonia sp. R2331 TaxID=3237238 RepID=UPI0034E4AA21
MDYATYLPGFLAAYAILLVGASSPGPAVALLFGIASAQGRGPALVTTAGISTGSATINVLTLIGVGLILQQAAWAMTAFRIIGAAYLAYLAYGAFKKALNPPKVVAASAPRASTGRLFIIGYLLQVTNPKAIAFWLAIAAVGATEGGGIAVILAFVAGAWAMSFICHGAWAVVLSTPAVRRAYVSGRRWIEGALGVFFGIFAFKLATSEA